MISYEYVASGLGHIKPFNKALLDNKAVLAELKKDIIKPIQSENNSFSMLYNSYTEPKFGDILSDYYKDALYKIHADSGGLQVVTLGKKITDDLKRDVYKNQANYANIGMSFDEIPVITTAERSSAANLNDRLFDRENLDQYITKSVDNLLTQIRFYKEHKSDCKPMYILHGNDYQTLMYWYRKSFDLIPLEYRNEIGGIALTDSAMGNGLVEDIIQAFAMREISKEFQKFHLLGIGSVRRLVPYIIQLQKTNKDCHLSYDSTTLTQGMSYGRFYTDFKTIKLGRSFNNNHIILKKMVDQMFQGIYNSSEELFFNALNSNSSFFMRDDKIDEELLLKYYQITYSTFFLSIKNFMNDVYKISNDKNEMVRLMEVSNLLKEFILIDNLNTIDDLNYLSKTFIKKSSKIPSSDSINDINRFF